MSLLLSLSLSLAAAPIEHTVEVGGARATVTVPDGWSPYSNPAQEALSKGSCWRTTANGSVLCARAVPRNGRAPSTILDDEIAAGGIACAQRLDERKDATGGGLVVRMCIDGGLFGQVRRRFEVAHVDALSAVLVLETTETASDPAVERAIMAALQSVRFAPVVAAGAHAVDLGKGWRLTFAPPPGWSRESMSFRECWKRGDHQLCVMPSGLFGATPDAWIDKARLRKGADCAEEKKDSRVVGGVTVVERLCVYRFGPDYVRQIFVGFVVNTTGSGAYFQADEHGSESAVTEALKTAIASVQIAGP